MDWPLFVDAIDEQAAGYTLRFGFRAIPDNPLLLFFSDGGPGGLWPEPGCRVLA